MSNATHTNTLERLPLWRLLGMLDDAERCGDVAATRLLTRVVRERLRAMRQQTEAAHA